MLQSDTFTLLKNQLQSNLSDEMQKVFKLYVQNEDDTILIARLLSEAEDLLHHFYEQNFSNNEIGVLMKLRQSRNSSYAEAFHRFNKNHKIEELVETLKDVIEDNLKLTSNKLGDPFNRKQKIK